MWIVRVTSLDGSVQFPAFMYNTWQEAHEAVWGESQDSGAALAWLSENTIEDEPFDVIVHGLVYWAQEAVDVPQLRR